MTFFDRLMKGARADEGPHELSARPETAWVPHDTSEETTELALTVELAQALARQPDRNATSAKPKPTHDSYYDEPEARPREATTEPPILTAPHTPPPLPGSTRSAFSDPARKAAGVDVEPSPDFKQPEPRGPVPPENALWVKTSKRARRNSCLRHFASWVISLVVGGFIITVVALILLGVPRDLTPVDWP